MIKALFSSTLIHILLIAAVIFAFSTKPTKTAIKQTKKISLKHIILKEQKPKKIQKPKVEPKPTPPQKPIPQKPTIKPKPKKIIKPKPKIKKKQVKKKKIKKTRRKSVKKHTKKSFTKTKVEPTPTIQTPKQEYLILNKSKIKEAIQRAKRYPSMAKKLHITGVVKVRFKLHPNGDVTDIRTLGAHKILQKSARNTIKEASPEFPKPNQTVDVSLNIAYKLR